MLHCSQKYQRALLILFFIFCNFYKSQNVTQLIDSLSLENNVEKKIKLTKKITETLYYKDWKRASIYLDITENLSKQIGTDESLRTFYTYKAEIFFKKEILDLALKYNLQALTYFDKKNDDYYQIINKIGTIYGENGNHNEALKNFLLALKYYQSTNNVEKQISVFNNIATVYLNTNQNDKALQYFENARQLMSNIKIENPNVNTYLLMNIGRAYAQKNGYANAQKYIDKAHESAVRSQNKEAILLVDYYYMNFYFFSKNMDSAMHYAKKVMTDSQHNPTNDHTRDAAQILYKCYLEKKDFLNTVKYFEEYDNIRKALNKDEIAINIEKIKITEEQKTKESVNKIERQKEILKYYLVCLFFLTIALTSLFFIFRYKKSLEKSKLEKELKEAEQRALNSKLELINKELISKTINENRFANLYNEIIDDLRKISIEETIKKTTEEKIKNLVTKIERNNKNNPLDEFDLHFNQIYDSFYKILMKQYPTLTKNDLRLCALIKIGLTTKEIAGITNQTIKSIENSRTRLRKKMNLTYQEELSEYLFKLS